MAEPTPEQAAVISAPLAPLAVVAGAGSGKSETMAARLVWLVANGLVRPERVLGLTFTRKAAAELADRVRARLDGLHRARLPEPAGPQSAGPQSADPQLASPPLAGPDQGSRASDAAGPGGDQAAGHAEPLPGEPVIATYHAYAGRLVADHALREALEPSVRLITPAICWQLAARVVAAYDGPMGAVTWAPATVTAAVLDLAGELSEHLRGQAGLRQTRRWLEECLAGLPGTVPAAARKVLATQQTREQLLPLVAAYQGAKAAREVIDYGDQMALAARIAVRHPQVGAAERARYQVVLLDEYQDTSHAQLVLLAALFGGGHPVTAVGDPCQSIYGWRGASAGNLTRFRTDFPAADGSPAPVRLLSTSFRNTGRVLDAAAGIQQELRAQAPQVPRLIAPPGRAGRGHVSCALLETAADEAEWVADRIAALLALAPGTAPDGRPWPDGGAGPVHARDIAILCRKRAQFPALRAALARRDIPVEVVGLGGLLTVPEVADIVATLRVMHDPSAGDALARLLTSPRWRIGPVDLVALGARARALAGDGAARSARGAATQAEPSPAGQAGPQADGHMGAPPGPAGPSGPPGPGEDVGDLLEQAVSDLTREPGSLIEALDDLGSPAAYSPQGYARFSALAAELRGLRSHAARSLPELVGEVERVLSLDIEVAARPGADPLAARADLDAFADAAAAFAGDEAEPTLGAFLAYLTAAEQEEFGLEGGRVGETDSVKLATVHAAKGLQWAAVFVPGLAGGKKGHVFPARPRVTTRWTENPRLLPFPLRGDAADLPALAGLAAYDLERFTEACAARELAEERRLAYVATTRAAYWLGCSGYWWGDGTSRLGPSVFLTEIRAACEAGAGTVAAWADEPGPEAENPALAEPASADWPVPLAAGGARYEAIREAGDLVLAAMAAQDAAPAAAAGSDPAAAGQPAASSPAASSPAASSPAASSPAASHPAASHPAASEPSASEPAASAVGQDRVRRYQPLMDAWARDAELLLAERGQRRGDGPLEVRLPRRIPVSSLVTVARDPAELAQQVRRPMPQPPGPQAQRGTEFHQWLEQRFGQQRLIDPDDLPGAADDAAGGGPDVELTALKDRFEAGAWASRWPVDVEVPFETLIGDRLVRGRIDAVFADDPAGGYDVVDWTTGRPPGAAAERRAVAVQLAAYRLAWAALAGVPVSEVRAAFYYVREDETVRPADLLDEAGLTALIEAIPVG
ncbi:MAG: UvrD-helicase domain-containing protein [Streptosporangiaceae bacterium]